MNINTVSSLAVLKVNWDTYRKDHIENFVSFIVHLFYKNKYEEVIIDQIVAAFEAEYGLHIPHFAMVSILRRVQSKGYIKQEYNRYLVVTEKVRADDFSSISSKQIRNINEVLGEFIKYAKENFGLETTEKEALGTIVHFLNRNDASFLFATDEFAIPRVADTKSRQYILANFIQHVERANSTLFGYILDLAIGYILASTIVYQELSNYQGNQKGINYFLDTGFIFSLLGVDGRSRQIVFEELVKNFCDEGVKLFVFQHTLDEAIQILNSAIRWVDNPLYDHERAGRITKFLKRNDKHESDIRELINEIPKTLKKNGIDVIDKPPYDEHKHNIDEESLRKYIVDTYRVTDPNFEEYEKEGTIQKDIDSISAIYRLRKGNNPATINRAKQLFITTNRTLSKVAADFHKQQYGPDSIPACSTDLFMGTLVWLKSPAKVVEINHKKIISDCYAALQPDKKLINLYIAKIKELKERKAILEEDYYLLRGHFAIDILEEKTLGDTHNFTDKTPEEILDKIKQTIKREEAESYKSKEAVYTEQISSLKSELEQEKKIGSKLSVTIERVSSYFSWFIFAILIVLLILVYNYTTGNPNRLWFILGLVFYAIEAIFGLALWRFRSKINNWLSSELKKIYNIL